MSHIFISYSRKDFDFAQRIVDALAAQGLDTWIDWKSIPKTVDWEEEIYHGIEEGDAFLFMISPDSVQSEMCKKEVAHAVKNGKRIIPVVICDVDAKIIPTAISKLNWIFCQDGQDDFAKAIEEMHEAIHTDYEWLKFHTELQVKALRWNQRRDTSRLLRGKELREAEQQLANIGIANDPQPTNLQRQYISLSRRNQEQLRWRTTFGLIIGLLVLIVISFVALEQRNEAVAQHAIAQVESTAHAMAQEESEKQAQLSLARRLSENSTNILVNRSYTSNEGIQQAMLLAIESLRRSPTTEGTRALIQGVEIVPKLIGRLNYSPRDSLFYKNDWGVPLNLDVYFIDRYENVRLSSDGRFLVTTSYVESTNLSGQEEYGFSTWDTDTWRMLATASIPVSYELNGLRTVSVALSSDSYFYAFAQGKRLAVWNTIKGQKIIDIELENPIVSVSFNSKNLLLIGIISGQILTIDTMTLDQRNLLDIGSELRSSVYSVDDNLILVIDNKSDLKIYNMVSGKYVDVFSEASILDSSPNGEYLAIQSGDLLNNNTPDKVIFIWDISSQQTVLTIKNEYFYGFNGQSTQIMTGNYLANIHVWDINTTQRIASIDLPNITFVGFSPISNEVAISVYDGTQSQIIIRQITSNLNIAELDLPYPINKLIFSEDGQYFLAGKSDVVFGNYDTLYDAYLYDIDEQRVKARIPLESELRSALFDSQNKRLFVVDTGRNIRVWDLDRGWSNQKYSFMYDSSSGGSCKVMGNVSYNTFVTSLSFSRDDRFIAVGEGGGKLQLWNLQLGKQVWSQMFPGDVIALSESYDGKTAAGNSAGRISLYFPDKKFASDVVVRNNTTSQILLQTNFDNSIATVDFSSDNHYFAAGDIDGNVNVWDTETWENIRSFTLSGKLRQISFSPKSRYLVTNNISLTDSATENVNSTLTIYKTSGWEEYYSFHIQESINSVAFDPEEKLLLFATSNGNIEIWNIANREKITEFKQANGIINATFANSGKTVISLDSAGSVLITDIDSGLRYQIFVPNVIYGAFQVSPDGKYLFLGSVDGTITVIDIGLHEVTEILQHGTYVFNLSISNDGKLLASVGDDCYARVWNWNPEDIVEEACKHIPRNFTLAEWAIYMGNENYRATCPNLSINPEVTTTSMP